MRNSLNSKLTKLVALTKEFDHIYDIFKYLRVSVILTFGV